MLIFDRVCIYLYAGGGNMCEEKSVQEVSVQQDEPTKIILPEATRIEMLKFFLQTSIPRKKREKLEKLRLSSNTNDGSDE